MESLLGSLKHSRFNAQGKQRSTVLWDTFFYFYQNVRTVHSSSLNMLPAAGSGMGVCFFKMNMPVWGWVSVEKVGILGVLIFFHSVSLLQSPSYRLLASFCLYVAVTAHINSIWDEIITLLCYNILVNWQWGVDSSTSSRESLKTIWVLTIKHWILNRQNNYQK